MDIAGLDSQQLCFPHAGPAPDQANQHPSLNDGWVTPIHGAVDFGWMLRKGGSLYFGDVAAVDCLGPGRGPTSLCIWAALIGLWDVNNKT